MIAANAAMRVLVVCSANRFRSPLAASLLRRECGYMIDVESAGLYAREGSSAHAAAQTMARVHGLMDISAHRTRPLTPQRMRHVDLILTMDEQQQRAAARLMPTYTGRVMLLGCWRGISIGEPIVTSQKSREWIFGLLQACVADWKERLTMAQGAVAPSKGVDRARRAHQARLTRGGQKRRVVRARGRHGGNAVGEQAIDVSRE